MLLIVALGVMPGALLAKDIPTTTGSCSPVFSEVDVKGDFKLVVTCGLPPKFLIAFLYRYFCNGCSRHAAPMLSGSYFVFMHTLPWSEINREREEKRRFAASG